MDTHCGGPNYPNIARTLLPPGPPSASGTEPDIRRDQVTMRITYKGRKKKRGEREKGGKPAEKDGVTSDISLRFSSKQTLRRERKTLRLSVFRLASFFFSLFKCQGTMTKLKTKKKKKRAKEGGERSGRIKIDKVSPFFFFLFPCKDCCDGPLSKWAGSSIVQKPKTKRRDKRHRRRELKR